jgi:antirestriction protein ArdC
LKQDSKAILKASAEAQKAVDYLGNIAAMGEDGLLDTDSAEEVIAA